MRNDIYGLMNEITNLFNTDGGYKSFPIDVVEVKGGYEVYAEMPGIRKEDIHLSFEEGDLIIEAAPKMNKEARYVIHERTGLNLRRVISFGDIDEDTLAAKYEDGILKICISTKMPEEKKAKVIEIE